MKNKIVSILLWCISGVIAFTFLILPDQISSSAISSNWYFRLFYAFFLCNPLIGSAKTFSNPTLIEDFLYKYRNTDKDSLIISLYLFSVIFTLIPILACYLALDSFYPSFGRFIFLFTIIYGALVGTLQYIFLKMRLHRLGDNITNNR